MTKRRLKIMRRAYSRPSLKVTPGLFREVETSLEPCYSIKWGLLWRMPPVRWWRITLTRRYKGRPDTFRTDLLYEFLCVHSNPIWNGRNCRDYRPSHLKFREYFRPFWFSRSCVVVACCNRRMRSSNVQGFVSTVPTLYKEEDDYAPLYRNRRMRSSNFTLHSSVS